MGKPNTGVFRVAGLPMSVADRNVAIAYTFRHCYWEQHGHDADSRTILVRWSGDGDPVDHVYVARRGLTVERIR